MRLLTLASEQFARFQTRLAARLDRQDNATVFMSDLARDEFMLPYLIEFQDHSPLRSAHLNKK